jgi:hypothetical protein
MMTPDEFSDARRDQLAVPANDRLSPDIQFGPELLEPPLDHDHLAPYAQYPLEHDPASPSVLRRWWLTGQMLAWRFDDRMADYEDRIEAAWSGRLRHVAPASTRTISRGRLRQLREDGLDLALRFDVVMACCEVWLTTEAHELADWSRPRLIRAGTSAGRVAHTLRPRRPHVPQRIASAQAERRAAKAERQAAQATRKADKQAAKEAAKQAARRTKQERARPTTPTARPRHAPVTLDPVEPVEEVVASQSLREQALDAWQVEQSRRIAERRQRHVEEAWVLRQLLYERLGVRVNPESRRAEVDGLLFTVRWSEAINGYTLVLVKQCYACGRPAASGDIRNLADLGKLVNGRPDAQILCRRCRQGHERSRQPSSAEQLSADIRKVVVEELQRQQSSGRDPQVTVDRPLVPNGTAQPLADYSHDHRIYKDGV